VREILEQRDQCFGFGRYGHRAILYRLAPVSAATSQDAPC
jgi:hypothetical protein